MTPDNKPEWFHLADADKSASVRKISKGLPIMALVAVAAIIGVGTIFAQPQEQTPANATETVAPAVVASTQSPAKSVSVAPSNSDTPATKAAEPVALKAEPVAPKAEPVAPKAEPVAPKAEPVAPKAPVSPGVANPLAKKPKGGEHEGGEHEGGEHEGGEHEGGEYDDDEGDDD